MPPASARPCRPGFLIYYLYEDETPVRRAGPVVAGARRTATVVAVLALMTLLSLTLGPAFQS
ncbi:hypothetical protein [Actinomadura sp. SCN-SB]|uniref:hypothetical protein n=1 Tax=Actinomadura sp. SCN-SB TaxID=3373092 RepID=UPI00375221D6